MKASFEVVAFQLTAPGAAHVSEHLLSPENATLWDR
jgi:hypothetical protein